MYAGHNYQFLWWAAVQQGRYAEAIEKRATSNGMPLEMLRAFPGYDFMLEYPIWTQIRFGKWTEALAETVPPEEFAFATAAWRAARGIINAAAAGGKPGVGPVQDLPEAIQSGSVFWGIFLIVLGIVLILANFEIILYSTLADFWPVVVIAIGLKLVFDSVAKSKEKK